MATSHFQPRRRIPSVSSAKSSPVTTNFAKGINTYKPNDTLDASELLLAQDARFDRQGEYKTRKGLEPLSVPIGRETIHDNLCSEDETYAMTPVSELGDYINCFVQHEIKNGCVYYGVKLRVSADDNEYGVLRIHLKSSKNASKALATTCIDPSLISSEPRDIEVIFPQAPDAAVSGCYIEIEQQDEGARLYRIGTRQGELMCALSTATKGRVTSIFEANLSNTTGTQSDKSILFTFARSNDTSGNETMYRLKEDGSVEELTTIATHGNPVRYSQEASVVRCVFGSTPLTLNPTNLSEEIGWSVAQIATTDLTTNTNLEIKVSNIINGTQDNLLYFDKETNTQAVWTYPYGFNYKDNVINSFDKFDRDFRQNFPSINTGDPLTAAFNIGGIIYILTRRHKYQLVFDTVESWAQSACAASGGTFSQESVAVGSDLVYFANESGIFAFDGYTEVSITKDSIQNIYDKITNKEKIRLDIHGNRLYVLYHNDGDDMPRKCLVYNLKLKLWESFDTNLYVSTMFAQKSPSGRFICGHNRMGMLMLAESAENRYNDMGAPIQFELRTAYLHYGTPSQQKMISKWRPEFASTDGNYSVRCGYALDLTDDVKYAFSVNLKNDFVWQGQRVWKYPDGAIVHESVQNRHTTTTRINGQFRRCQIRYQHYAAFEPVNFKSHTLTIQTRRIR